MHGGGANVLHLSRGNPGYISGFAPLRLDLRACANESRPRISHEEEAMQDDVAVLGHAEGTLRLRGRSAGHGRR